MSRRSYMSMYDSDSDNESKRLLDNVVNSPGTADVGKTSGQSGVIQSDNTGHTDISSKVLKSAETPTGQSNGYEEFFRDTVPCVTCRGSGRIHKDEEKKLVAIIPLTDKRLKPRRTCVYVILTVTACILVGALLLFFLIPRSVDVFNNSPTLFPTIRIIEVEPPKVITKLVVTNCYNFSNNNYYAINLMSLTVTASLKRNLHQVGQGNNTTEFSVSSRGMFVYCAHITIFFKNDEAYITYSCVSQFDYNHFIPLEFRMAANYSVLGQHLQTTMKTLQYVDCGNDTRMETMIPPVSSPTTTDLLDLE